MAETPSRYLPRRDSFTRYQRSIRSVSIAPKPNANSGDDGMAVMSSGSNRSMLSALKIWAYALRRDVHAVYLAARDPRVPWYAKLLAMAVAGYALSPIDLIPDFIPVVGYLDDLIIVPLGIWLVVRL